MAWGPELPQTCCGTLALFGPWLPYLCQKGAKPSHLELLEGPLSWPLPDPHWGLNAPSVPVPRPWGCNAQGLSLTQALPPAWPLPEPSSLAHFRLSPRGKANSHDTLLLKNLQWLPIALRMIKSLSPALKFS